MCWVNSSFASVSKDYFCLKEVFLSTSNMHPQLRLSKLVEHKVDKVKLNLPIDCKKGKVLVPKNEDQAVEYLDIMLPIDFKTGLIHSKSLISIYLSSPYGGSVIDDLHNFLYKPWKLNKNTNICYTKGRLKDDSKDCFEILIEKLVKNYKNPSKY